MFVQREEKESCTTSETTRNLKAAWINAISHCLHHKLCVGPFERQRIFEGRYGNATPKVLCNIYAKSDSGADGVPATSDAG